MEFGDLTLLGVICHLQASVNLENDAGVLLCCLSCKSFSWAKSLLAKQCILGDMYLRSNLSRKSLLASNI